MRPKPLRHSPFFSPTLHRLRPVILPATMMLLAATLLLVPAASATAAPGAVKLPDHATVKGRTLLLPIKNRGTKPVSGTVALKQGGRNLARASFRVGPGKQRRLGLKLSRAKARKIVRGGKLKLVAVVRAKMAGEAKAQVIRHSLIAKGATGSKPSGGGAGGGGGGGAIPIDGNYYEGDWVMAIEDGIVKSFSGSIATYCTVTRRQKKVYFAMLGDDPKPKVKSDGSYSWEATTNYGFVKLKFDGRVAKGVARGKMMVEDRSMILGSGRIEFDYCFAGRDYVMNRDESQAGRSAASLRAKHASPAQATASKARHAGRKNRRSASSGWRIHKVTLDGWSEYRLVEGENNFTAEGRIRYRTKGRLSSQPVKLVQRRPALATALVAQGVTWRSSSDAKLTTATGSWTCTDRQQAPRAGLAGAFTVLAKKVRVQWSLAPTVLRCPSGSPKWSFPGLPLKAMTSTFPRRLLKGQVARVPVEIQHRWRDEAGLHEVHWDGAVVLRRATG